MKSWSFASFAQAFRRLPEDSKVESAGKGATATLASASVPEARSAMEAPSASCPAQVQPVTPAKSGELTKAHGNDQLAQKINRVLRWHHVTPPGQQIGTDGAGYSNSTVPRRVGVPGGWVGGTALASEGRLDSVQILDRQDGRVLRDIASALLQQLDPQWRGSCDFYHHLATNYRNRIDVYIS